MATWIVVSCATPTIGNGGCFGFWMESDGHKRVTRWSNQHNIRPYRQCVEKESPHKDLERRPYG